MDLLIPASGYATRMNQIPKFLLPGNIEGKSLLEIHLALANKFYENILIATRPDLTILLDEKKLGNNVRVISLSTSTMTETVLEMASVSSSEEFALIMPDTYFMGEHPHQFLATAKEPLRLALWEIQENQRGKLGQVKVINSEAIESVDKDPDCTYPYSWGALGFTREYLQILNKQMPHVGYGISPSIQVGQRNVCKVMAGIYYDCGTPTEYFSLIKKISG